MPDADDAAPTTVDQLTSALLELQAARAGVALDPFKLPPVVGARRLLADTVAQLPLVALRDNRPRDFQPSLLRQPDPAEPRWLTLHRLVNSMTRYGVGYLVETLRDGNGAVAAVRVCDGRQLTPTYDSFGRMTAAVVLEADGTPRAIDPRTVTAVPYNVDDRGPTSPLDDARPVFEWFAGLYAMAGSFWEAGYPSLAIRTKQRLSDKQASALKLRVVESWRRRHEPAVIDADGEITAVGASAVEQQLVEALSVVVAEVSRVFAMPPSLLNAPAASSLTYATTESEFRRWLGTGLQPVLMRIEAAFAGLITTGDAVRLDTFELFRSDLTGRADAYATILAGQPWMTTAEVRELEHLPPMSVPAPADQAAGQLAPAPAAEVFGNV